MKKINLEVYVLLAALALCLGLYLSKVSENDKNKAFNEALIQQASKRIKQDKERIKNDSIALYDQKIEFTEHINNLNINRRNELNDLKRKLSQLKLVTNSDYINRNDSLYKYLQGSR